MKKLSENLTELLKDLNKSKSPQSIVTDTKGYPTLFRRGLATYGYSEDFEYAVLYDGLSITKKGKDYLKSLKTNV